MLCAALQMFCTERQCTQTFSIFDLCRLIPMEEEVLFEEVEHSDQSSTSIEVVTEKQPAGYGDVQDVPQIDGQGIYDFEIDNMEEKPWEKPGADITDYFNYGFNEHTWKKYCAAQREFVKGIANKKSRGEKHTRRREERERYSSKGERKGRNKEEHVYEEKEMDSRREEKIRRSRGKRSGRDKRYSRR